MLLSASFCCAVFAIQILLSPAQFAEALGFMFGMDRAPASCTLHVNLVVFLEAYPSEKILPGCGAGALTRDQSQAVGSAYSLTHCWPCMAALRLALSLITVAAEFYEPCTPQQALQARGWVALRIAEASARAGQRNPESEEAA